ncbi:MAG: methyltransferase domain-containing protein [Patescibacteria group bacterium]|jgi:ubiquinone/menaquinone biosynthesis C-methylase UbiE
MNNIWDKVAKPYNNISNISAAHQEKFDFVSNFVIANRATSLLDLGCGSGLLEKSLIRKGFSGEITALDSSKMMLEIARLGCIRNSVNFLFFNLNQLSRLQGAFESCVAINSLFLVEQKKETLMQINRLLLSKGFLILIEPTFGDHSMPFFINQLKKEKFGLLRKFFSKSLIDVLRVAISQRGISNMIKKKEITLPTKAEWMDYLKGGRFEIISEGSIQLDENYYIIARKTL